jgi:hypothetical protein
MSGTRPTPDKREVCNGGHGMRVATANAKREPREAAAEVSRIQSERNGCLPLAPRSGLGSVIGVLWI